MMDDYDASGKVPLNLGAPEDFRRVAGILRDAGFTEQAICTRLGIEELHRIDSPFIAKAAKDLEEARDPLASWILLFVLGRPLHRSRLESMLSREELAALRALDLLRLDAARELCVAPVRLVSLAAIPGSGGELLIASDRGNHPDGTPLRPFPDFVFSAHNPLTRQFLSLLPAGPAATVLDLCTGTGVAALAAASSAERVVAVDIAARSAHFAAFNRLLNGVGNVEIMTGDLYEPVAGMSFDRIIAHPPYVPSFYDAPIYRNGGDTGEKVVRRILQGIPEHLNRGGTFHTLGIAMDAEGKLFEERAREWMGGGQDIDLIFALREPKAPEEFGRLLGSRSVGAELQVYERWMQLARSMRIENVVYGALVGHRHPVPRKAQTRRVQFGSGVDARNFERLFGWFDWLEAPGAAERILEVRLRMPPELKLEVTYGAAGGELQPEQFHVVGGGATFPTKVQVDAWVVSVLVGFASGKRGLEVYADLSDRGKVPPGGGKAEFAELLLWLVERDILRLEDPQ